MRKLILKCGLSPGDIVMLTAAVRDLHRCCPGQFLTDVRTVCPDLWEHNPYLTPLSEDAPGVETIECSYPLIDYSNQRPYHCLHGFTEFLNRRLSLRIAPTAFKGDVHLSAQEKAWHSQVRELTGADTPFWIVGAGGKYDLTIKWWDTSRYQEVVNHFQGRIQFVQVGNHGHHHPRLDRVIDLRGQTTLRELIRLVYHAEGVLCPVTALMHLAAAVESRRLPEHTRPCVVIAGGREPAHWEAYPGHQFIHTNGLLPCCASGGCWKDRTLPLGDGDRRDAPANRCVAVVNRLPRCMDLITPAEVIRRIESYYQGGSRHYLRLEQRPAAALGVLRSAQNPFDGASLNLPGAGLAFQKFTLSIPPCPEAFEGRGIVICGGGVRYFTAAWVCISMLRHLGCRLPIQFWHLGNQELNGRMKGLLAGLEVQAVDALKMQKLHPARRLGGWELKPYAILNSPFREVLLLDADNVPIVNPEFLFATPQYRKTGAVFWPDYDVIRTKEARTIWRSCGLRPPPEREFETGQILVDKQRTWKALRLTMWLNEHSDFYYQYLHGDKETFHLAFRKLRQPYALVRRPVVSLEGTMCQHDFHGRRIFQHRNSDKWDLFLRNRRIRGFRFDAECRTFVRQLQQLWDGRIARSSLGLGRASLTRRSKTPKIQAVMFSSPDREPLRTRTLASLARTDWGAEPVHFQPGEPSRAENLQHWKAEGARRALQAGLEHPADYLLFLEDDLVFNRHLRHNLINWRPVKAGQLVVASLYNPSVKEAAIELAANARIMEPRHVFGSQALVLSRSAVEFILRRWHAVPGNYDVKLARLGGQVGKHFFYHAPSLVQHTDPVQERGGVYDRAMDFDPDWKAKRGGHCRTAKFICDSPGTGLYA